MCRPEIGRELQRLLERGFRFLEAAGAQQSLAKRVLRVGLLRHDADVLFERRNRAVGVSLPQGGISEHVLRATGIRIERGGLLQRGDGLRIFLIVEQLLPERVVGAPVAGRELRETHE